MDPAYLAYHLNLDTQYVITPVSISPTDIAEAVRGSIKDSLKNLLELTIKKSPNAMQKSTIF